jgi:hypothetical protein
MMPRPDRAVPVPSGRPLVNDGSDHLLVLQRKQHSSPHCIVDLVVEPIQNSVGQGAEYSSIEKERLLPLVHLSFR